jgi:putative heme-binding domain-containing protein
MEVGPDLKRAYSTSKETLLRDVLWPSEKITSGYEIYVVTTNNDEKYSGVLVSESANSVVLRQVGGMEQAFLRKDIKKLISSHTSLMPSFEGALTPQDCADIIEWLRVSLASK